MISGGGSQFTDGKDPNGTWHYVSGDSSSTTSTMIIIGGSAGNSTAPDDGWYELDTTYYAANQPEEEDLREFRQARIRWLVDAAALLDVTSKKIYADEEKLVRHRTPFVVTVLPRLGHCLSQMCPRAPPRLACRACDSWRSAPGGLMDRTHLGGVQDGTASSR